MRKSLLQMTIISLFAILSSNICAQDNPDYPNSSPEASQITAYTQEQLDQMIAPIALYPDSLLAQVLMAATYPREAVEAARWLQNPDNAALHGDQLAAALQPVAWDPSIKALVVFPDIVRMMNSNLQWVEELGDAFIGQEAGIMDGIQRLRRQALDAGTLWSSPSQTVTVQDGDIVIEPANPDVIYVPIYNPTDVYGTWPYPEYPPDLLSSDYITEGALIEFGTGIFLVPDLFYFHHLDFRHHRIDIDDRRFRSLNGGHPPVRSGLWTFDPGHRHRVPYRAPGLQRTAGSSQVAVPASQRPFRGFGVDEDGSTSHVPPVGVTPAPQRAHANVPVTTSRPQGEPVPVREQNRYFGNVEHAPVSHFENRRPSAPVFESQTSGFNARSQSARGQSSRSEMGSPGENRSSGGGGNRSFGVDRENR